MEKQDKRGKWQIIRKCEEEKVMKKAIGCSQKHSCKNASQTENRNLNILMWTLSCPSTSQFYTTHASTFSLHFYSFSTGHFFWTYQDPNTKMWWSVTAVSPDSLIQPTDKLHNQNPRKFWKKKEEMSVPEKLLSDGEKWMDLETIQYFVAWGFFFW